MSKTFVDNSASGGATYYYTVKSKVNELTSLASNEVNLVTAPTQAITGLAVACYFDRLSLTWNAAPGVSTYKIGRKLLDGGGWHPTQYIATTANTYYEDIGMGLGTTYYYTIYADTPANSALPSAEVGGIADYPSLIPTMTSNTTPSGVVTVSGGTNTNLAYKTFGSAGGGWFVNLPAWLTYDFGVPVVIKAWVSAHSGGMTGSFQISGSNDGSSWTQIDDTAYYDKRRLSNTTAYRYAKVSYTAYNGGNTNYYPYNTDICGYVA